MTCIPILNPIAGYKTVDGVKKPRRKVTGYFCFNPTFRLRLGDGRYVFMDWHRYCGPNFFYDRDLNRIVQSWWEDELICKALDWFIERGERA